MLVFKTRNIFSVKAYITHKDILTFDNISLSIHKIRTEMLSTTENLPLILQLRHRIQKSNKYMPINQIYEVTVGCIGFAILVHTLTNYCTTLN